MIFTQRLKDPTLDTKTWAKMYEMYADFRKRGSKKKRGGMAYRTQEMEIADIVKRIESGEEKPI